MSEAPPPRSPATTRAGFIALLGAPNAGKSTLLNRLAGAKLSIVSPKPQTTRFRVLGIVMRGSAQLLFVDTPGIFRPRRRLDRAMVHAAWSGAGDADIAVLLVDAEKGLSEAVRAILEKLRGRTGPTWLAVNKIDLVAPADLLPLVARLNAELPFAETFMLSASTGDGVERLLERAAQTVPEGPHLYPPEDLTDLPDRILAAEIVRERIYAQTREEVPYGATVETEKWEERRDGSVAIHAVVYAARPGQKAILVGKQGARIKAIGAAARGELEKLLERRVHLFLRVVLRERWDEERDRLSALGLEDPG
jgi:GTP-binding protein Era